jgi:hypothetical protein
MKKVFIVWMEAYDDFGVYMGKNIVGIYTTLEVAQEKVDRLKSFDEAQTQQFIGYQYAIEEGTLEGE